jgi:hypothetical protein
MGEGKRDAAYWGQVAVKRSECMSLLATLARRKLLPEENVRLDDMAHRAGCADEVRALERAIIGLRATIEQMGHELNKRERKEALAAQPSLFDSIRR